LHSTKAQTIQAIGDFVVEHISVVVDVVGEEISTGADKKDFFGLIWVDLAGFKCDNLLVGVKKFKFA